MEVALVMLSMTMTRRFMMSMLMIVLIMMMMIMMMILTALPRGFQGPLPGQPAVRGGAGGAGALPAAGGAVLPLLRHR
jgi:hypothetical protein